MRNRAPIQDAIDRRNFKQDLASTVIKRSRVRFVTEEDLEAEKLAESVSDEGISEYADDFSDDFRDSYAEGFSEGYADDEEAILERILAQNKPNENIDSSLDDDDNWGSFEGDGAQRHGLVDEPDLDLSGYSEDVLSAADEILARLKREAEEDEEMRKQEWLARIENGEV